MIISILGKVIFGLYFLYSGFNHFKNEKMLTGYTKSKGVPYPRLAVLLSGAMMILGGLGFVLNTNIKESSILLIIFLVPTTFMIHNFWKESNQNNKMNDQINFMKNIALIGALLMIL